MGRAAVLSLALAVAAIASSPAAASSPLPCPPPMALDEALKERVLVVAEAGQAGDDDYREFDVVESFNAALPDTVEVYDAGRARAEGRKDRRLSSSRTGPPPQAYERGATYALALVPLKNGAFETASCDAPEQWMSELRRQ